MDLLRAANTPGHGGRGRDAGGYYQAIAISHDVGRAQELDVRDIRCPPGGSGQVRVAFRPALSGRPGVGTTMSTRTTMEQGIAVDFSDRLVDRFDCSVFGTTRANVS